MVKYFTGVTFLSTIHTNDAFCLVWGDFTESWGFGCAHTYEIFFRCLDKLKVYSLHLHEEQYYFEAMMVNGAVKKNRDPLLFCGRKEREKEKNIIMNDGKKGRVGVCFCTLPFVKIEFFNFFFRRPFFRFKKRITNHWITLVVCVIITGTRVMRIRLRRLAHFHFQVHLCTHTLEEKNNIVVRDTRCWTERDKRWWWSLMIMMRCFGYIT